MVNDKPFDFPTPEFHNNLQSYGREYLQSKKRFRVLKWHRGSHKTTHMLHRALIRCVKEVGLYWHIFPYLNEGTDTVWKDPSTNVFRWIPPQMMKNIHVDNSAHSLTFPNGSVYQLKGADNPDSLRGAKPKHVFVDEYGEIAKRHGNELREAILEPSVRSSGGGIDYAGTPKGNNDFETIFRYGSTREDWWSSKKTVYDTGIYSEEEIADIKVNITNQDLFMQEYMCEVMDGAMTVFKGHLECATSVLMEPILGHSYVFGIDLARTFDKTAIVGFDVHTNAMVYFRTLSNQSWEQQKMNILSTLSKYNGAQAVVDATGVGDSFVDQLIIAGGNIYPFKIGSNLVKRNLIEKLAMYFENKYLTYPPIDEIKDELNSFEYTITNNNNVTYSAPSGKHDDIVLAMALAVQILNMTPQPFKAYSRMDEVREEMANQMDPRTGYLKI